ncbi:MAG TPA: tyrosine-type recombinase/integrase [Caldilineaceae bacterium]|nr:tyrosine-type recombinase/integrase [Caldilineaceae bacterium]
MTTDLATIPPAALATTQRTDDQLISLFLATKRSEHTRTAYRHSIGLLLAFVGKPLAAITLEDAVAYHTYLKEVRNNKGQLVYASPHSVKLHINVAKSLCSFAVGLNYLVTNVFAPIKPDTAPEITHKRILSEEEVMRLIDAPKTQRDKLILRLLYAAGLRVAELCNLSWDDLGDNGVLHVRSGKGQKDRFITLSGPTYKRLMQWRVGHQADKYIFTSQVKERGGGGHERPPSEGEIHRIVKSTARRAGISAEVSAHWLRHSHGSHALDRGASIVTVRDTLGHSNIATTNKYLHGKRGESSALHLGV